MCRSRSSGRGPRSWGSGGGAPFFFEARRGEACLYSGEASVLEQLEAERALWLNEQAVVQVRLAELNNRVQLFKALGG